MFNIKCLFVDFTEIPNTGIRNCCKTNTQESEKEASKRETRLSQYPKKVPISQSRLQITTGCETVELPSDNCGQKIPDKIAELPDANNG